MAIRATKSGWLIACKVLKETKKYYHLIDLPEHESNPYKVAKDEDWEKVFTSDSAVDDAFAYGEEHWGWPKEEVE